MNEDKRIIKIAFEVTDNFELQLEDIRKMFSNKIILNQVKEILNNKKKLDVVAIEIKK